MTPTITLLASGYTWTCPECKAENYTGPAPVKVTCKSCRAEWDVGKLEHRHAKKAKPAIAKEQMQLFGDT